ncbi:little elongation complex subunit 1 [Stomoxys calcitrans]|uniref:little elongation complex subunit 1 n=1 Tax=Stomoxys calcitrans TaxID=35570 RepID=UPI0027E222E7|nr:little elongation complex subunit 1 [Stomoxys calcitrans]
MADFDFGDLNLDFLQTTPPKAIIGNHTLRNPAQKQKKRLEWAKKIASADELVKEIHKLKCDNLQLHTQLKDFQKTASDIQVLYATEKRKLEETSKSLLELQRKYEKTDSDLTIKSLKCEQLEAWLENQKECPVEYNDLVVKYLKLIHKYSEEDGLKYFYDRKLVDDLKLYCDKFKIRYIVPTSSSPKKPTTKSRTPKIQQENAAVQCDIWKDNAPVNDSKEKRNQGIQCQVELRSQGTQHISTMTTRSTTTTCFIKFRNVGTNFPETLTVPAVEDILNEFTPWQNIKPISPLMDRPQSEEIKKNFKTIGTCTWLCNIRRPIDFMPRAVKRVPNTQITSCVQTQSAIKQEITTPSPSPTPNVSSEANNVSANNMPVNSTVPNPIITSLNLTQQSSPAANPTFHELWHIFGRMVLGLLHTTNGSNAGISANSVMTQETLNQRQFHNWLRELYDGSVAARVNEQTAQTFSSNDDLNNQIPQPMFNEGDNPTRSIGTSPLRFHTTSILTSTNIVRPQARRNINEDISCSEEMTESIHEEDYDGFEHSPPDVSPEQQVLCNNDANAASNCSFESDTNSTLGNEISELHLTSSGNNRVMDIENSLKALAKPSKRKHKPRTIMNDIQDIFAGVKLNKDKKKALKRLLKSKELQSKSSKSKKTKKKGTIEMHMDAENAVEDEEQAETAIDFLKGMFNINVTPETIEQMEQKVQNNVTETEAKCEYAEKIKCPQNPVQNIPEKFNNNNETQKMVGENFSNFEKGVNEANSDKDKEPWKIKNHDDHGISLAQVSIPSNKNDTFSFAKPPDMAKTCKFSNRREMYNSLFGDSDIEGDDNPDDANICRNNDERHETGRNNSQNMLCSNSNIVQTEQLLMNSPIDNIVENTPSHNVQTNSRCTDVISSIEDRCSMPVMATPILQNTNMELHAYPRATILFEDLDIENKSIDKHFDEVLTQSKEHVQPNKSAEDFSVDLENDFEISSEDEMEQTTELETVEAIEALQQNMPSACSSTNENNKILETSTGGTPKFKEPKSEEREYQTLNNNTIQPLATKETSNSQLLPPFFEIQKQTAHCSKSLQVKNDSVVAAFCSENTVQIISHPDSSLLKHGSFDSTYNTAEYFPMTEHMHNTQEPFVEIGNEEKTCCKPSKNVGTLSELRKYRKKPKLNIEEEIVLSANNSFKGVITECASSNYLDKNYTPIICGVSIGEVSTYPASNDIRYSDSKEDEECSSKEGILDISSPNDVKGISGRVLVTAECPEKATPSKVVDMINLKSTNDVKDISGTRLNQVEYLEKTTELTRNCNESTSQNEILITKISAHPICAFNSPIRETGYSAVQNSALPTATDNTEFENTQDLCLPDNELIIDEDIPNKRVEEEKEQICQKETENIEANSTHFTKNHLDTENSTKSNTSCHEVSADENLNTSDVSVILNSSMYNEMLSDSICPIVDDILNNDDNIMLQPTGESTQIFSRCGRKRKANESLLEISLPPCKRSERIKARQLNIKQSTKISISSVEIGRYTRVNRCNSQIENAKLEKVEKTKARAKSPVKSMEDEMPKTMGFFREIEESDNDTLSSKDISVVENIADMGRKTSAKGLVSIASTNMMTGNNGISQDLQNTNISADIEIEPTALTNKLSANDDVSKDLQNANISPNNNAEHIVCLESPQSPQSNNPEEEDHINIPLQNINNTDNMVYMESPQSPQSNSPQEEEEDVTKTPVNATPIEIPLDLSPEYKPTCKQKSLVENLIWHYSPEQHNIILSKNSLAEQTFTKKQQPLLRHYKSLLTEYCSIAVDVDPDVQASKLVEKLQHTNIDFNLLFASILIVTIEAEPSPVKESELTSILFEMPPRHLNLTLQRLFYLLKHLMPVNTNACSALLQRIESHIFTCQQVEKISLHGSLHLAQLYLIACKFLEPQTHQHPARCFIAKCLYYYSLKAIPMIHEVLMWYPTALPPKEDASYDRSNALITVIQHCLMCTKYDMERPELRGKALISKLRYEYHYTAYSPTIEEVTINLVDKLKTSKFDKDISISFALFGKRLHPSKTESAILQAHLLPLANEYFNEALKNTEYDARISTLLEIISMIVKPFPLDWDIDNYLNLFSRFLNAFGRKIIQEAAVCAILRLQRFGFVNCFSRLRSFNPNFAIEPQTQAMFKSFIHRKKLPFLKTILNQNPLN